jgi:tRNA-modifying protein YgfZ
MLKGDIQVSASGECRFGEPAAEAALARGGTVVAPLTHLALIRATGADAAAFLQGQLSNDVRQLGDGRAQLSSYNSPKGRMLAVLHLLRAGDGILLELDRAVLETVLKRLRMFVLRSKVTLDEARDLVAFGVAGPDAPRILADLGLVAPAGPLDCTRRGDLAALRRLGEGPRYSLLAPAARADEAWQQLRRHAPAVGTLAWKLLDIDAGIPTVYPATQDRFVPQMCNLDALGGISFDKGCYTGQEVVARVHYRGAVKRHMSKVETPQAGLAPGAALPLPDGREGEVVDCAPLPDGVSAALVVAPDP